MEGQHVRDRARERERDRTPILDTKYRIPIYFKVFTSHDGLAFSFLVRAELVMAYFTFHLKTSFDVTVLQTV